MDTLARASAGDRRAPGPHRPDDDRRRAREPTRSSASGAAWTPRATSRAPRWASRRRSCCSATTTTAATRPGSAGPTAATTSSPARRSSARADRSARADARGARSSPARTSPPTATPLGGRLRRTAALGRLAATEAAKYAATSAANLGRTPGRGRRRARPPPGRRGARRSSRVLGSMKGVAMKAGQVLSVVDLEAVPPAYRERGRRRRSPSCATRRRASRSRT